MLRQYFAETAMKTQFGFNWNLYCDFSKSIITKIWHSYEKQRTDFLPTNNKDMISSSGHNNFFWQKVPFLAFMWFLKYLFFSLLLM